MSKKKKAVIALCILVVMLVAFIGGQAYAKYISQVRGNGIAEIATWSFKVNGEKEQVQEIRLASTCNNQTLVNNKIAPGTSGSFNIKIDATGSDVGINYNITFAQEENKPQNLKFVYGGIEYSSIKELEGKLSGMIEANERDKTRTINVRWQWDYETGRDPSQINENDIVDTKDATNVANYTFQVIVTGTQIQPQA
ncbi:MAG: hypothetical protein EGQ16_06680 [Clostridiales bacterium]|nr:hypothetical protein [Clostridiales bacterium]